MNRRIEALALIIGAFEAVRELFPNVGSKQRIPMIAKHLQLHSHTRKEFLESVVRCANQFLHKKGNKKKFDELLNIIGEEETNASKPNHRPSQETRSSKIARDLASCARPEVTRFFDLMYTRESAHEDVCFRI
jgi:ABC-type histidine transport system ATPase subunit